MRSSLIKMMKCLSCGEEELFETASAVVCTRCGAKYPIEDGVIRCLGSMDSAITTKELNDWERNAEFYLEETKSSLFKLLHAKKIDCYNYEARNKRILDIGSGIGFFCNDLKSQGAEAIALDFSVNMLRLAQRYYHLQDLLQASAAHLPFVNDSFDAVVANGVLHHLKAQHTLVQAVREIRRILKPDGVVLIYDRNGALLGKLIHGLALLVKRSLEWIKGPFSASSSANEPDFNDNDLNKLIKQGFTIERRWFVSTLPTFLAIITTNTIQYLVSGDSASKMRRLITPIIAPIENSLDWKWFTVEQCLRLRKIN